MRRLGYCALGVLAVVVAAALLDVSGIPVPGSLGGCAFSSVVSASSGFVPGGKQTRQSQTARNRMTRQQEFAGVRIFAESPKVQPEPDIGNELTKIFKGTLGVNDEQAITAKDRITPLDRWLGFDKSIINARDEDDPFVDSSDALSYVTVTLEKPLGIELLENPLNEGGGVMVGEVRPGYSAYDSNLIDTGYHLIQVDDTPVYGFSFEEAIKPILDKDGLVTLTFFKGDAVYFYGEFRPSAEWLAEFVESLKLERDLDEQ